eukprot:2182413-Pyramimonas_sp.AAC.1
MTIYSSCVEKGTRRQELPPAPSHLNQRRRRGSGLSRLSGAVLLAMSLLACGLGAGQALMALARLSVAGQAVVAQAMGL